MIMQGPTWCVDYIRFMIIPFSYSHDGLESSPSALYRISTTSTIVFKSNGSVVTGWKDQAETCCYFSRNSGPDMIFNHPTFNDGDNQQHTSVNDTDSNDILYPILLSSTS
ncbi:hypothetical protein C8R44DRAFT_350971 [Mycena epipterygia]|nr:hypothetical protein C8R44DRAFT_350971 [Mycena epipterygia]